MYAVREVLVRRGELDLPSRADGAVGIQETGQERTSLVEAGTKVGGRDVLVSVHSQRLELTAEGGQPPARPAPLPCRAAREQDLALGAPARCCGTVSAGLDGLAKALSRAVSLSAMARGKVPLAHGAHEDRRDVDTVSTSTDAVGISP